MTVPTRNASAFHRPTMAAVAFGGPYLGFFAFRRDQIRRSSGRIAGETVDRAGARGYVFTLSTREQHIRRDKATSNICTNQSLNALAAAVYLSALGRAGCARLPSSAGTRRTTRRGSSEPARRRGCRRRVLPRVRGAMSPAGRGHQPSPVRVPRDHRGIRPVGELPGKEEMHARVLHGDDRPGGHRGAGGRTEGGGQCPSS